MSKAIVGIASVALFAGIGMFCSGDDKAADATPKLWFYRDVPEAGAKDERSDTERYFAPFYFYPVEKAAAISVNASKAASELSADETGTCVEIVMRLNGKDDDWAGVGWIAGGSIGAKPARNLIDRDRFIVGFGRPVVLKWRARTAKDQKLKVHFMAFGFSSGALTDGIRPALTPDPETSQLTDKWTEFSVNVTEDAAGLNSVVVPLQLAVRGSENVNVTRPVIYVDDLRLEIAKAEKK